MVVGGVGLSVDTKTQRHIRVLSGRRDQDFLGTGIMMLLGVWSGMKEPCRFYDDINAQILPRKIGRIPLRKNCYVVPVDIKRTVTNFHCPLECPVH